jgi:serine/threonine protein kinase
VVNLAREVYTGMIVALKVMDKKKILQDNLLVQFIRELKIQSFLDHPNIIRAYGYFADEDNFYTVLELGCDGQLYDVISTGQTLSEESTSFIIGNLLDAVCLMHRHKILHRDIKPENIVLVHVTRSLLRATSNCATSDGQSTRNRNSGPLSAGRHSTYPRNSSRAISMTRRWISGQWAFSPTNCTSALPPSTSASRKISSKSYLF